MRKVALLLSVSFLFLSCMHSSNKILTSPNGLIQVQCKTDGDGLEYTVQYRDDVLINRGSLGFIIEKDQNFEKGFKIQKIETRSFDETWKPVWGNQNQIRNHYHEMHVFLQDTVNSKSKFELVFRAYDDGIAFRYIIPEQPNLKSFQLKDELTTFIFDDDPTVWAVDYGSFRSPQESEFVKQNLSQIPDSAFVGCPLLLEVNDSTWAAVTEANLTDWAGLYFSSKNAPAGGVKTMLSHRLDDPSILVKRDTPAQSPWRVIMIGDQAGDLIESELIYNLNDPCQIEDPSWIKPGISAWDRWWCGSYAPDYDGTLGMDTESMKYFIDFAAEMDWEYQLVDWFWYGQPFDTTQPLGVAGNPNADILKSLPEIDIPELVRYAGDRGVKILLWLDSFAAARQMEDAFPLYEKWGVAGVKIDFMNRDDQEMVNWYHDVIKLAARHHLLIDFHGAYKPTGVERTWPNFVAREGVMGNEYNKWSDLVTPVHTVTLPFTRMLCGPMDFTPGGFLNHFQKDFHIVGGDSPAPQVMGTRCHQLAMMVVYESPLQVMCDSPYNYRNNPAGLDFLKQVPTTWDETHVLSGEPGESVVIARRSGQNWYIGAMNGGKSKKGEIVLDFIDPGSYHTSVWADKLDRECDQVDYIELALHKDSVFHYHLQDEGGLVMVIQPE